MSNNFNLYGSRTGTTVDLTSGSTDINVADITADAITCTALTFPKPFSEIYMEDNATATAITNSNEWTKVAGTTTANSKNQSFDNTTANKMIYTGTMTKMFHWGATFSINPSTSADIEWSVGISKNGVHLTGSKTLLHSITNGHHYSSAIHIFAELATNDYLELEVQNNTNTSNVEFNDVNIFAMALPNDVS